MKFEIITDNTCIFYPDTKAIWPEGYIRVEPFYRPSTRPKHDLDTWTRLTFQPVSLAQGFQVLEEAKTKLLARWKCEIKIDEKEVVDYLREAACKMDGAIREAVPILKSGRRRRPSEAETKTRRLLQAAL